jgi:hypothetical protein
MWVGCFCSLKIREEELLPAKAWKVWVTSKASTSCLHLDKMKELHWSLVKSC